MVLNKNKQWNSVMNDNSYFNINHQTITLITNKMNIRKINMKKDLRVINF